jgi:hypothetical protein
LLAIVTRRKRNVGQCIAAQHRVRLIGSFKIDNHEDRSPKNFAVRISVLLFPRENCLHQPFKKSEKKVKKKLASLWHLQLNGESAATNRPYQPFKKTLKKVKKKLVSIQNI